MTRHVNSSKMWMLAALAVTLLVPGAALAQEDIAANYYPNLGFSLLDQDERQLFVSLADGELCPCPGTPRSLSECLQETEGRCRLAEDVASLMMRRIKEDEGADDVRDEITRYLTDATTPREFDLSDVPVRGPYDSSVQIVVFSDFQCPHCRRFANTTELLREEFGPEIGIFYFHFPLVQHEFAQEAALAAIAAGEQEAFWEMHDLLFERQVELAGAADPTAFILDLAGELELDVAQFEGDMSDESNFDRIQRQLEMGRLAGVNSTPTVFVNGVKFLDDESFALLRAHINTLL